MFPTGSFDRMKSELWFREYEKCTDIPITVGILIADYRRRFCKENVINQIERLDKKSGPLIDFYIPGYCKTAEIDEVYLEDFRFKGKSYSFSVEYYNEFIEKLEKMGVEVTGRTQFLLIPYENNKLQVNQALCFDLENDENKSKIVSTKLFFDSIFEISKETTQFEVFKRKIAQERVSAGVIRFLKENLPNTVLSLILSSLK